jgi:hypothetical protein
MANWLINLNWEHNIEIWRNCRQHGRAAIGWGRLSDDQEDDDTAFRKALSYLREMELGDRVIAFLKDRRLGCWGTVTKPYDPSVRDPQFAIGSADADFARVVHVQWVNDDNPPPDQAARMRPADVVGFQYLSTINRLNDDAFEKLRAILADRARWEPLYENEEAQADDATSKDDSESVDDEWHAPLREAALRSLLARDLSLIEPGLKPLDGQRGAEEFPAGEAGRIDLLCVDAGNNPVVIELKRDDSSDHVVGQLARYMGYVAENHLQPGRLVRGIIVAHSHDERLRLALRAVPNTEVFTYTVKVELHRSPVTR